MWVSFTHRYRHVALRCCSIFDASNVVSSDAGLLASLLYSVSWNARKRSASAILTGFPAHPEANTAVRTSIAVVVRVIRVSLLLETLNVALCQQKIGGVFCSRAVLENDRHEQTNGTRCNGEDSFTSSIAICSTKLIKIPDSLGCTGKWQKFDISQ